MNLQMISGMKHDPDRQYRAKLTSVLRVIFALFLSGRRLTPRDPDGFQSPWMKCQAFHTRVSGKSPDRQISHYVKLALPSRMWHATNLI